MKDLNTIETREEFSEFINSMPFEGRKIEPWERKRVLELCEKFGVSKYVLRSHADIFPHK